MGETPVAAAGAATRVDAGAADAGPPLIDLLHASRAEVTVSSVVLNHTDRPENLTDGLAETAWSSRTGELEGAEIDFRVPDDSAVEEIALSVGMTRAADAGDLFTMNPRIASVIVYRGYDLVGTFPLDVDHRALQAIPIHRRGGLFRIVIHRVVDGSQPNWREVSVSELEVRGRTPAPQANVPAVRVGRLIPVDLPPPYMIPATNRIDAGCFAWSATEHAAACIRGAFGSRDHGPGDDDDHWTVAFLGGAAIDDIDLVDRSDGAYRERPSLATIPAAAMRSVRTELARGRYADLSPLAIPMIPGVPIESGHGPAVRWTRRRTFAGGDNAAERFTDRLEVRWTPHDPWTLIEEFVDEAAYDPHHTAHLIPGDRYIVVSAVRNLGDEGVSAEMSYGWLCDATTRTCQ